MSRRRINGEEALGQDAEKRPSNCLQRGSPVDLCQESPVEGGAESDTLKCSFKNYFLRVLILFYMYGEMVAFRE